MRAKTSECQICSHPERARIELSRANGLSVSKASAQFGVSRDAIWRHWKNHVSADLKDRLRLQGLGGSEAPLDLESLKRSESESLLQNLLLVRARLLRIADAAEVKGNFQDATRASGQLVRIFQIEAQYLGELRTGATHITNNLMLSGDWIALRRVIATALRPHREAQKAVLEAVREYETAAGADVNRHRSMQLPALEHEEAVT